MNTKVDLLINIQRNLNYYLLFLIAFTMPFSIKMQLNSFLIILLVINWIFSFRLSLKNAVLIVFISFYGLHILSFLLLSSEIKDGTFELQKKLSLLVFPLVLSNIPRLSRVQIDNILKGFVVSCFISSIVCLAFAFFKYLSLGTTEFFFYHSLVEIIGMHGSYFSMYLCFSIFIVFNFYFNELRKKYKLSLLLLVLYFTSLIFLLSARTQIVSFFIISFIGVFIYYFKNKKIAKALFSIVTISVLFICLIYFNNNNLERFKEAINYKSQYGINKQWGGRALREQIWDCAFDVANANLLFGVGEGNVQKNLNSCFTSKNYGALFANNMNYNSHNQFLQTTIEFGLIGLFFLITCFAIIFYFGIKERNYLSLVFITLFLFACFTESTFEVNKGVVFYSFFSSIFLFHSIKKDDQEPNFLTI